MQIHKGVLSEAGAEGTGYPEGTMVAVKVRSPHGTCKLQQLLHTSTLQQPCVNSGIQSHMTLTCKGP